MLSLLKNISPAKKSRSSKYGIYVYHRPPSNNRLSHWRKVKNTNNIRKAVSYAQSLHKKDKYDRIEIKKNYFCRHEQDFIGKTIRIYKRANSPWKRLLSSLAKK